ncbi:MAG: GNAT family N-acetyltransferase [Stackebrandtia sp.]
MNSSIRCEVVDDIGEFATAMRPWLDAGPPSNQVVSTILDQRVSGVVAAEPGALWIKVLDGADLVGAVIRTPPRGLLLTAMPDAAVAAVVEAMGGILPNAPSANGPKQTSDRFSALWSVRTGCTATAVFASRLHEVTDVVAPNGVSGHRRPAVAADRDTVVAWLLAFAREAMASETPGLRQLADTFESRLGAGQPQWIWELDGRPVSFAMESPVTARTVRIQAVYTPDQHRGNGYASANVAEISTDILSREGIEHCTLYTDLSNPVSNGVYRKLGYRPVTDMVNYGFEYPN